MAAAVRAGGAPETRDAQQLGADTERADLWMVLAIIQPFKLDAVMLALLEAIPAFGGMTVSDCRGFGHGRIAGEESDEEVLEEASRGTGDTTPRDSRGVVTDFTRKVRVEIAVAGRARAEQVVETIARAAHTGRRGDGKVFAWPMRHAVRVRTFDEGERAL